MSLIRIHYLPLIFFGWTYFLTCYLGTLLLLWGPTSVRQLYKIYAGVNIPGYSSSEFLTLLMLLHLPVVCLGIGYFFAFKIFNQWVKGTIEFKERINSNLILFCWAASLLLGAFSVWRGGAIDNVAAWTASYDNWVVARWMLFKTLVLVEFINLYVLLPVISGLALLTLWEVKKKAAFLVFSLGLMVTLLLFQKKQPIAYVILVFLPFWMKTLGLGLGTRNTKMGWSGSKAILFLIAAYAIMLFIPTLGLSNHKEDTLVRGDFILGKSVEDKSVEDKSIEDKTQNIVNIDLFTKKYLSLPDISKQILFMSNSVVFRTSAPAMYYPVVFPAKQHFYGLDLPFDRFTADDNLDVWKVMWPNTPGGSVSAPFQFSLYAQVGLIGTMVLSIIMGILIGFMWAWFLKIDLQTPATLMVGTLTLVFAIYLAIDSARNSIVSSYGLVWGGIFLVILVWVSRIRIRRG